MTSLMGRMRSAAVVLALWTVPTPALAAEVEFGWTGSVATVDPSFAAALPPDSGLAPGATVWVSYVFDDTVPDANPGDATVGEYPNALVAYTLQVGNLVFRHTPGGSPNTIGVYPQAGFESYQALNSVTASPAVPGYANLDSDVFFGSQQSGLLPDDSLPLSPLDPPQWEIATTGLTDGGSTTLFDADLTSICVGACQPTPPPAPVPLDERWPLAVLILACGVVLLAKTPSRGRARRMPAAT